jgi:hypothetical protein
MRRLALTAVPVFALAAPLAPSFAADLDGPVYRERDVVIERPAAPVVRERIIERNYYYYDAEPAPGVHAYAPTYYSHAPAYFAYAPRVYRGYAYDDGYRWHRRRAFFVDRPYREAGGRGPAPGRRRAVACGRPTAAERLNGQAWQGRMAPGVRVSHEGGKARLMAQEGRLRLGLPCAQPTKVN